MVDQDLYARAFARMEAEERAEQERAKQERRAKAKAAAERQRDLEIRRKDLESVLNSETAGHYHLISKGTPAFARQLNSMFNPHLSRLDRAILHGDVWDTLKAERCEWASRVTCKFRPEPLRAWMELRLKACEAGTQQAIREGRYAKPIHDHTWCSLSEPATWEHADLSYPILAVHIPDTRLALPRPGHQSVVLIGGVHRVAKAIQTGAEWVRLCVMTPAQEQSIRVAGDLCDAHGEGTVETSYPHMLDVVQHIPNKFFTPAEIAWSRGEAPS